VSRRTLAPLRRAPRLSLVIPFVEPTTLSSILHSFTVWCYTTRKRSAP